MSETRLAVNIDHVATLRQARRSPYPDPVAAAAIAEQAGATGITVHLRGDRRHIQDRDVRRLRGSVRGTLNLEMAPTEEMLAVACEVAPDQVTLVPERPEEVTTEGGLDLGAQRAAVTAAAERLNAAGIRVSLFVDPHRELIDQLAPLQRDGLVGGFEINTDRYTKTTGGEQESELERIRRAATAGAEAGLAVYAGHGLTTENVGPVAAVREIEELNIGHWLISRAVTLGLAGAVTEMLAAMRTAG